MKKYFTLFLIGLNVLCVSQNTDFNHFKPIKSQGMLPKEFSSSSVEKYQAAKDKISSANSKIEKEALKDYELESSFAIDDILHSGKVIFNDTISGYVNAVMQKLMEQREKKKNVRVYVLRSSVVNAYATGKGIIFVTMGLIARMHSEAELAFVLAHEYIHYIKKHTVKGYIESKKAQYGTGQYHNTSIDDRYLKRVNFSKEQEQDADEMGFDLFTKTNYSISAAATSLNSIWYYYLPFDSVAFLPSFFERGSFHIPDNYFKKEYKPVDAADFEKTVLKKSKDEDEDEDEDDKDKYSTHPSTDKRIERLKELEKDFGNSGNRSLYLVSESGFKYIRKLCRFEIPRINLIDGAYEYAMYHSMVLLKEEPNSLYLKKIIAKALYSMAKYGNVGYFNSAHLKTKYTQGTFQQLVYLTGKLKAQGLSAAAMNYCWQLKTENPDDEELSSICRSLMGSIAYTYVKKKKHVFYTTYADTTSEKGKHKSIDDEESDDKPSKSKAKKSKKNKLTVEDDMDNEDDDENIDEVATKSALKEYVKRSLIYWFENDSAFNTLFKQKVKEVNKKSTVNTNSRKKKSNVLWVNNSDVESIKDNKVILIDPFYSYYYYKTTYGGSYYDAVKSEQYKTNFTDALFFIAGKVFNDYEVLDQDNLKTDEAEKLSEITVLRDCLLENLNKKGAGLVSTDLSLVKEIAAKYKSSNLLLTGMIIEKKKSSGAGVGVCTGPLMPIYIIQNVSRGYQYAIYTVLYNTDLDDFRLNYYRNVRGKDTQTSLRTNLYQIFIRLKTY